MNSYKLHLLYYLILHEASLYNLSKTSSSTKSIIETRPFYNIAMNKKAYISLYNLFQTNKKIQLALKIKSTEFPQLNVAEYYVLLRLINIMCHV